MPLGTYLLCAPLVRPVEQPAVVAVERVLGAMNIVPRSDWQGHAVPLVKPDSVSVML